MISDQPVDTIELFLLGYGNVTIYRLIKAQVWNKKNMTCRAQSEVKGDDIIRVLDERMLDADVGKMGDRKSIKGRGVTCTTRKCPVSSGLSKPI